MISLVVMYLRGVPVCYIPSNHCHVPSSKDFTDPKLPLTDVYPTELPKLQLLSQRGKKAATIWFLVSEMGLVIKLHFSQYISGAWNLIIWAHSIERLCLYKEPGFCSQNWLMFNTILLLRNWEAYKSYLCFLKLKVLICEMGIITNVPTSNGVLKIQWNTNCKVFNSTTEI